MPRHEKYRTASHIIQLANAIIRQRNVQMQRLGLTACQSETILYLLKQPADRVLTAGDVAQNLHLSQSTVAGVLKRLEDKGLIVRMTATQDRRRSVLLLTDAARALDQALFSNAVLTETILLDGMNAAQREQLNRLLRQALANLNQKDGRHTGKDADESGTV